MPGSLPNPILYFPIKIALYSAVGWGLNRIYGTGKGINPLLFGILRVVIGFAAGLALLMIFELVEAKAGSNDAQWLLATRLLVWTGMIWFLYERNDVSILRFAIVVIATVLVSFGFDFAYSWLDSEFPGLSVGMC